MSDNVTEKETLKEKAGAKVNANEETVKEVEQEESKAENQETGTSNDEIAKLKSEVESLKDSWQRERAEFQNYKRRTAQDFIQLKREAVKTLVGKLLNPIDNLERVGASAPANEDLKPFVDGVDMIRKEFMSVLEKESVFKLDPKGEPFDPMSMEAIASEESEDYTEEIVLEVYQSGYAIQENNEKIILRPSRVKVGKPKF